MKVTFNFSKTVELKDNHLEMLVDNSSTEEQNTYTFEVEDEEELEMLVDDIEEYEVDFFIS